MSRTDGRPRVSNPSLRASRTPTCSSSATALQRTASRRRKPRRTPRRDLAREVGRRRPPRTDRGAPAPVLLAPARHSRTHRLRLLPGQRNHQQRRSDGWRTPFARHLRRRPEHVPVGPDHGHGCLVPGHRGGPRADPGRGTPGGGDHPRDAPDRPGVRVGQLRRSAGGVPRHLGSPPGTVRRFQPRPGDGSGHPAHRAVRSRQLSLPGPAARPSPDRVLRRGAALPRRLDAPGHRGLCVSRRGGGRRAGIPDLLVSELARPGHQPGADARGSLGLSVAERDLPEGRSGRGLLQHGASPAGPGIPAQPRWPCRYRTPGGGGRGPEHRPPAPAGRHRCPGDRLPPRWRRAGPASGSPEVAGRRRPDAPRTGNADRPAGILRGSEQPSAGSRSGSCW